MLPFEFDCSLALAEVMLTGRATHAGIAATLVRLASQGWVVFSERDCGDYEVRLRQSMAPKALPSDGSERVLLRWLSDGTVPPGTPSMWRVLWPEWMACLEQQAIAEGMLTPQAWRCLTRWRLVAPIAKRAVPAKRVARWQAYAERLKRYPAPTDPLPGTREEWETAFAYAVALGQARAFLRHAREVCEYYERNFEGIVITFFTPRWYLPHRVEGQARFAFLTGGFSSLFASFHWNKMTVGVMDGLVRETAS